MQVSVETTSELGRKITVEVPEEKIQEQLATRLKSLASKVKIDGFRPGKAPQSLIHKRYGSSVREEVVADLIQSSFYEAIREEKLNPAAGPQILPKESAEGRGLTYVADFEIMPEFVLFPLESLQVKRYVSEVTGDDLDAMVLRLREQRKTWRTVERAAAQGDRLTVTFEGKTGEESFTNGKVENFQVVLGSNQLIPGFEDKLVGASAGSNLTFELSFPDDYGVERLAGKPAEFSVAVESVEESVIPELDSEFVKSFGVEDGDIGEFSSDIKQNMEREMKRALQNKTKSSVMEALYERHSTLTLPNVLVGQELDQLVKPYMEAAQKRNQPVPKDLNERFEPIARQRVALRLILDKIIEATKLTLDRKRVRAVVEELALSYEDPQQVVNWYYANPDQLSQVENMVLEEQLVDTIIGKAVVAEEKIAFKELMQSAQDNNA